MPNKVPLSELSFKSSNNSYSEVICQEVLQVLDGEGFLNIDGKDFNKTTLRSVFITQQRYFDVLSSLIPNTAKHTEIYKHFESFTTNNNELIVIINSLRQAVSISIIKANEVS